MFSVQARQYAKKLTQTGVDAILVGGHAVNPHISHSSCCNSKYPVFEVTWEKKVVWKLDNPEIGHPTDVKALDSPTDRKRLDCIPYSSSSIR